MAGPLQLTKADARRALLTHHFTQAESAEAVFHKLRSIQFDPIAPAGCNHDLVLQARLPDYKIGEWEKLAYNERKIYDGWDKQASLVPYEGWAVRRLFHGEYQDHFKRIFEDHAYAVEAILKELEANGPLLPRELEFQERKAEWKGSWLGPSLAKQTLRALWHTGRVMTAGRRKGHHVYDLAERVVPPDIFNTPPIPREEAVKELILDRHRAMGLLRPNAGPEIWSYGTLRDVRHGPIAELVSQGEIVPVDVEGMKAHATPAFLQALDQPVAEKKVTFIAPLDPFMWDRKMIALLFGFDYSWEIYTPLAKRRWGYYVLPVAFGDDLVGRVEFWSRDGNVEMRVWHTESDLPPDFLPHLEHSLRKFMNYCSAQTITALPQVEKKIAAVVKGIKKRK